MWNVQEDCNFRGIQEKQGKYPYPFSDGVLT